MSQTFSNLRCGDFLFRPAPPPPQARTGAAAMTCIKRTKCPGVCTKVFEVPAACFGCMFSLTHLFYLELKPFMWSIKKKYWATTFWWKNDHGMSGIVSFPIGDYQTAVCYEIRISQSVVKCTVDGRSDWRPCPRSQGNKHSLNEQAKDIVVW